MPQQWELEFSRAYDVPREITTHPQIYDVSWRHNPCPTFCLRSHAGSNVMDRATLTVDHPVASSRENPGNPRFVVWCPNGDGELEEFFSSETDCAGAIDALLALE